MPTPTPAAGAPSQPARLERLAQRMRATGQWSPAQAAGRRWTIGCVSLEITQRCNLDCTLCYLSDSAEAVRDIPLQDLFRRIDQIAAEFGPHTDVQISGGDPTLRDKDELSQIVRYMRARGLRASLFTNGILLNRPWLERLVQDGLNDVAFHVDMTQERAGYTSEAQLHSLRKRYIDMARGLPLSVIFNTTVFAGNMHEIPSVVDFFVQHNDVVRFASFQLGADTGRGTEPGRDSEPGRDPLVHPLAVTQASVCQAIEQGAGVALNFDALHGGHRSCNRYAMLFTIGQKRFDALADGPFVAQVMRDTANIVFERDQSWRAAWAMAKTLLSKRHLLPGFIRHTTRMLWQARRELPQLLGQPAPIRKISFFTHNFMDACGLDAERIDACVFMAATVDGPVSMCAYNAERDTYLLKPIRLANGETWQPLAVAPNAQGEVHIPLKWLKGKPREAALAQRSAGGHAVTPTVAVKVAATVPPYTANPAQPFAAHPPSAHPPTAHPPTAQPSATQPQPTTPELSL
jgi:7,8-dihydro-6-hydroxymethylpterin dimethyltransferase